MARRRKTFAQRREQLERVRATNRALGGNHSNRIIRAYGNDNKRDYNANPSRFTRERDAYYKKRSSGLGLANG